MAEENSININTDEGALSLNIDEGRAYELSNTVNTLEQAVNVVENRLPLIEESLEDTSVVIERLNAEALGIPGLVSHFSELQDLNVNDSFEEINTSADTFNNTLQATKKTVGGLIGTIQNMGTVISSFVMNPITLTNIAALELSKSLNGVASTLGKGVFASELMMIAGVAPQIGNLATTFKDLNDAINSVKMGKLALEVQGVDSQIYELSKRLRGFGMNFAFDFGSSMELVRNSLAEATSLRDVSSYIATLRTATEGISINKISDNLKEIAKAVDYTKSAAELAVPVYDVLSATMGSMGDRFADTTAKVVTEINKYAAITKAPQEDLQRAAIFILKAYNQGASQISSLLGELDTMIQKGIIQASDIASMSEVFSTAAVVGIKRQEVMMAMAELSTKMSAPQAVTALNSLLMTFLNKNPMMVKALKTLNVELDLANKGIIQTVQEINEAAKGNATLIKEIARDSRAFIGFSNLTQPTSDELAAMREDFQAASQAGSQFIDTQWDTYTQRLDVKSKMISNKFKTLMIDIGQEFESSNMFATGINTIERILDGILNNPFFKDIFTMLIKLNLHLQKLLDLLTIAGKIFSSLLVILGSLLVIRMVPFFQGFSQGFREAARTGNIFTKTLQGLKRGISEAFSGNKLKLALRMMVDTDQLKTQGVLKNALGPFNIIKATISGLFNLTDKLFRNINKSTANSIKQILRMNNQGAGVTAEQIKNVSKAFTDSEGKAKTFGNTLTNLKRNFVDLAQSGFSFLNSMNKLGGKTIGDFLQDSKLRTQSDRITGLAHMTQQLGNYINDIDMKPFRSNLVDVQDRLKGTGFQLQEIAKQAQGLQFSNVAQGDLEQLLSTINKLAKTTTQIDPMGSKDAMMFDANEIKNQYADVSKIIDTNSRNLRDSIKTNLNNVANISTDDIKTNIDSLKKTFQGLSPEASKTGVNAVNEFNKAYNRMNQDLANNAPMQDILSNFQKLQQSLKTIEELKKPIKTSPESAKFFDNMNQKITEVNKSLGDYDKLLRVQQDIKLTGFDDYNKIVDDQLAAKQSLIEQQKKAQGMRQVLLNTQRELMSSLADKPDSNLQKQLTAVEDLIKKVDVHIKQLNQINQLSRQNKFNEVVKDFQKEVNGLFQGLGAGNETIETIKQNLTDFFNNFTGSNKITEQVDNFKTLQEELNKQITATKPAAIASKLDVDSDLTAIEAKKASQDLAVRELEAEKKSVEGERAVKISKGEDSSPQDDKITSLDKEIAKEIEKGNVLNDLKQYGSDLAAQSQIINEQVKGLSDDFKNLSKIQQQIKAVSDDAKLTDPQKITQLIPLREQESKQYQDIQEKVQAAQAGIDNIQSKATVYQATTGNDLKADFPQLFDQINEVQKALNKLYDPTTQKLNPDAIQEHINAYEEQLNKLLDLKQQFEKKMNRVMTMDYFDKVQKSFEGLQKQLQGGFDIDAIDKHLNNLLGDLEKITDKTPEMNEHIKKIKAFQQQVAAAKSAQAAGEAIPAAQQEEIANTVQSLANEAMPNSEDITKIGEAAESAGKKLGGFLGALESMKEVIGTAFKGILDTITGLLPALLQGGLGGALEHVEKQWGKFAQGVDTATKGMWGFNQVFNGVTFSIGMMGNAVKLAGAALVSLLSVIGQMLPMMLAMQAISVTMEAVTHYSGAIGSAAHKQKEFNKELKELTDDIATPLNYAFTQFNKELSETAVKTQELISFLPRMTNKLMVIPGLAKGFVQLFASIPGIGGAFKDAESVMGLFIEESKRKLLDWDKSIRNTAILTVEALGDAIKKLGDTTEETLVKLSQLDKQVLTEEATRYAETLENSEKELLRTKEELLAENKTKEAQNAAYQKKLLQKKTQIEAKIEAALPKETTMSLGDAKIVLSTKQATKSLSVQNVKDYIKDPETYYSYDPIAYFTERGYTYDANKEEFTQQDPGNLRVLPDLNKKKQSILEQYATLLDINETKKQINEATSQRIELEERELYLQEEKAYLEESKASNPQAHHKDLLEENALNAQIIESELQANEKYLAALQSSLATKEQQGDAIDQIDKQLIELKEKRISTLDAIQEMEAILEFGLNNYDENLFERRSKVDFLINEIEQQKLYELEKEIGRLNKALQDPSLQDSEKVEATKQLELAKQQYDEIKNNLELRQKYTKEYRSFIDHYVTATKSGIELLKAQRFEQELLNRALSTTIQLEEKIAESIKEQKSPEAILKEAKNLNEVAQSIQALKEAKTNDDQLYYKEDQTLAQDNAIAFTETLGDIQNAVITEAEETTSPLLISLQNQISNSLTQLAANYAQLQSSSGTPQDRESYVTQTKESMDELLTIIDENIGTFPSLAELREKITTALDEFDMVAIDETKSLVGKKTALSTENVLQSLKESESNGVLKKYYEQQFNEDDIYSQYTELSSLEESAKNDLTDLSSELSERGKPINGATLTGLFTLDEEGFNTAISKYDQGIQELLTQYYGTLNKSLIDSKQSRDTLDDTIVKFKADNIETLSNMSFLPDDVETLLEQSPAMGIDNLTELMTKEAEDFILAIDGIANTLRSKEFDEELINETTNRLTKVYTSFQSELLRENIQLTQQQFEKLLNSSENEFEKSIKEYDDNIKAKLRSYYQDATTFTEITPASFNNAFYTAEEIVGNLEKELEAMELNNAAIIANLESQKDNIDKLRQNLFNDNKDLFAMPRLGLIDRQFYNQQLADVEDKMKLILEKKMGTNNVLYQELLKEREQITREAVEYSGQNEQTAYQAASEGELAKLEVKEKNINNLNDILPENLLEFKLLEIEKERGELQKEQQIIDLKIQQKTNSNLQKKLEYQKNINGVSNEDRRRIENEIKLIDQVNRNLQKKIDLIESENPQIHRRLEAQREELKTQEKLLKMRRVQNQLEAENTRLAERQNILESANSALEEQQNNVENINEQIKRLTDEKEDLAQLELNRQRLINDQLQRKQAIEAAILEIKLAQAEIDADMLVNTKEIELKEAESQERQAAKAAEVAMADPTLSPEEKQAVQTELEIVKENTDLIRESLALAEENRAFGKEIGDFQRSILVDRQAYERTYQREAVATAEVLTIPDKKERARELEQLQERYLPIYQDLARNQTSPKPLIRTTQKIIKGIEEELYPNLPQNSKPTTPSVLEQLNNPANREIKESLSESGLDPKSWVNPAVGRIKLTEQKERLINISDKVEQQRRQENSSPNDTLWQSPKVSPNYQLDTSFNLSTTNLAKDLENSLIKGTQYFNKSIQDSFKGLNLTFTPLPNSAIAPPSIDNTNNFYFSIENEKGQINPNEIQSNVTDAVTSSLTALVDEISRRI
jgi:chromosome segregation ATPase